MASVNHERLAQTGLILLLVIGCWLVLAPFFPAILFSAVVAMSTWPAYEWLLRRFHGHVSLASLAACVLITLLAVAPAVLLMTSLADGLIWAANLLNEQLAQRPVPPPAWLAKIPLAGETLRGWWIEAAASTPHVGDLLARFAAPAQRMAFTSGRYVGNALLQSTLVVLLLYFLYRNGAMLAQQIRLAASRIGGTFGLEMLDTARHSVIGVMFSIVGAGLAQATLAALGYAIAGVPNPVLLGSLTFFLSLVAFGPPILWIGASIWLFREGSPAWAIFMLAYGMFAISSIDNLLKPMLISRANNLSFVLTMIGVLGGMFAFGVMGAFLGPALLALVINLSRHWLEQPAPPPA